MSDWLVSQSHVDVSFGNPLAHTQTNVLGPPPQTPNPTHYTLHPTPYTLHTTPYTLHTTHYTLHTTP